MNLPKKGRYYMFPSYLDHFVTRNNSEEKRISISFNFERHLTCQNENKTKEG